MGFPLRLLAVWLLASVASSLTDVPLAKALIILVVAAVFGHALNPRGSMHRALAIGLCWLTLSIATELLVSLQVGHEWSPILGYVSGGWSGDLLTMVWIVAPLLAAFREGESNRRHLAVG
jgi:ABC-type multidrug transport system permease subunit